MRPDCALAPGVAPPSSPEKTSVCFEGCVILVIVPSVGDHIGTKGCALKKEANSVDSDIKSCFIQGGFPNDNKKENNQVKSTVARRDFVSRDLH